MRCARKACDSGVEASCRHRDTGEWYCPRCARLINEANPGLVTGLGRDVPSTAEITITGCATLEAAFEAAQRQTHQMAHAGEGVEEWAGATLTLKTVAAELTPGYAHHDGPYEFVFTLERR